MIEGFKEEHSKDPRTAAGAWLKKAVLPPLRLRISLAYLIDTLMTTCIGLPVVSVQAHHKSINFFMVLICWL